MKEKILSISNQSGMDLDLIGLNERFQVTDDKNYCFEFRCQGNQFIIRESGRYWLDNIIAFIVLILLCFLIFADTPNPRPDHNDGEANSEKNKRIGILGLNRYYSGLSIIEKFADCVGIKIYKDTKLTFFQRDNHPFLFFGIKEKGREVPLSLFYDVQFFQKIKNRETRKFYIISVIILLLIVLDFYLSLFVIKEPIIFIMFALFNWLLVEGILCLYHIKKKVSLFCDFMKNTKEMELSDDNIQYLINQIESFK